MEQEQPHHLSDTRCAAANCIFSVSGRGAAYAAWLPSNSFCWLALPFSLDGFPCASCLGIVSCPTSHTFLTPLAQQQPAANAFAECGLHNHQYVLWPRAKCARILLNEELRVAERGVGRGPKNHARVRT